MSPKIRKAASRVSDHIETALWAMLVALVIYFVFFLFPNIPEAQAQMERIRVQEIAAENASFCERLDIKRGTDRYNQCLLDIGQFRLKVEKRVLDYVY
jgi:hypothetical protein